uniref:Mitochondrial substrate carrier family protein W n=1 Tax=Rhizophora mucronata TaxID=61149 RepID=A0A2P2LC15_RHIMU
MFSSRSGSIIITSLQNIIKNEGFRGLYRGLSPTILALLPNWAVSTTFCISFHKISAQYPQRAYLGVKSYMTWEFKF